MRTILPPVAAVEEIPVDPPLKSEATGPAPAYDSSSASLAQPMMVLGGNDTSSATGAVVMLPEAVEIPTNESHEIANGTFFFILDADPAAAQNAAEPRTLQPKATARGSWSWSCW